MAHSLEPLALLPKVPLGTIMPLAADVTESAISTQLLEEGWLPCIGLSLKKGDYRSLFDIIQYQFGGGGDFFNLPDLRGLFVRGAQAPTSNESGGVVGTLQESATHTPVMQPFVLDEQGEHAHTLINLPTSSHYAYYTAGHTTAAWDDNSTATSATGAHSHVITSGGDKETRPLNVYVDFVIKFQEVG